MGDCRQATHLLWLDIPISRNYGDTPETRIQAVPYQTLYQQRNMVLGWREVLFWCWNDSNEEQRHILAKKLRKATRKDKMAYHLKIINSDMSCKDIWQSITRLRSDYVPTMYARKDKDGRRVALDKRAEATADYLSQVQWGKRNIWNLHKMNKDTSIG